MKDFPSSHPHCIDGFGPFMRNAESGHTCGILLHTTCSHENCQASLAWISILPYTALLPMHMYINCTCKHSTLFRRRSLLPASTSLSDLIEHSGFRSQLRCHKRSHSWSTSFPLQLQDDRKVDIRVRLVQNTWLTSAAACRNMRISGT